MYVVFPLTVLLPTLPRKGRMVIGKSLPRQTGSVLSLSQYMITAVTTIHTSQNP